MLFSLRVFHRAMIRSPIVFVLNRHKDLPSVV